MTTKHKKIAVGVLYCLIALAGFPVILEWFFPQLLIAWCAIVMFGAVPVSAYLNDEW